MNGARIRGLDESHISEIEVGGTQRVGPTGTGMQSLVGKASFRLRFPRWMSACDALRLRMPPLIFRLRKHADYQRVYKASRKQFAKQMSYFFVRCGRRSRSEPTRMEPWGRGWG